jgi:serine/threonine protein kinase/predicted Zn-dependent protease
MPVASGTRVGHFEIVALAGAGGMGEVYRAIDVLLGRPVALKLVSPEFVRSPERLARFEREARAASALNHPNIVTIYEVGFTGEQPFLAMEFVEGVPLGRQLRAGALHPGRAFRLAAQIADALAAAHASGVTHRDLKPDNVMVTADDRVKLLDFGVAKFNLAAPVQGATGGITDPGALVGTPEYMAPEQARGAPVDFRADQFTFGVLLWEMLSGRHPFRRPTSFETLAAILSKSPGEPPLSADFPSAARVIERVLAKDPQRRYDDTHELARAIAQAAAGAPGSPTRVLSDTAPRKPRVKGRAAVAVLPLVNGSANPESDYLCDGLTEAIISNLASHASLRVMARGTVFRYKGSDVDPRQVARELGVSAVVMGSVLHQADRLTISVELVDGFEGTRLWGETYSRRFADVFAIQNQISSEICERLRGQLSGTLRRRTPKKHTPSSEAYQLYLKGRYFWNKRTPDGIRRAIALLQQATDADPAYPLAYAGLADCYSVLGAGEYSVMPPRLAMPKAQAAAQRALELDEQLSEAHSSLSFVRYWYEWDWPGSEREFQRALELSPGNSYARLWHADFLAAMGRFESAEREARTALDLDPLSAVAMCNVGRVIYYARDFERALEEFRRTIEFDPQLVRGHLMLAVTLSKLGECDEAVASVDRAIALAGGGSTFMTALRGQLAALSGRREEASTALRTLDELPKERYVPAYVRAGLYTVLDDSDRAFQELEKAYHERSNWMVYLKVSPLLDSLRQDPRYDQLLARVGLLS